MNLYDYIYVDIDKAVSLYSQLTGGMVEIIERQNDQTKSQDSKRHYNLKVFQHEASNKSDKHQTSRETLKPHHSFLQELESELENNGHLIEISSSQNEVSLKNSEIRQAIKKSLCIKCTGRIVIEDYERLKNIAVSFPDIYKLIQTAHLDNIKKTPEYIAYQNDISNTQNKTLKREKEKKLANLIKEASALEGVDQWILDGMQTWINSFMSGITNIRVYPTTAFPDEHIFGHLEPHNFTIQNSNSLHFTYGSLPTEEMTMVGIVTSVPEAMGESFDPLKEMQSQDLGDLESIENAFRSVFRGFDTFEAMIRTNRYPRIQVHPLLVYRQSTPVRPPTLYKKPNRPNTALIRNRD